MNWRRTIAKIAAAHGAHVETANNNHLVIRHPSGWRVVTSSTPSDRRTLYNVRAAVRRAARGDRRTP